ncbi:MAG TPA: HD domain-containing protein [Candidatus Omnitrophota bacterium]|nr:HD domain-containing protein [Candidatus Omnitrophota bacterium]
MSDQRKFNQILSDVSRAISSSLDLEEVVGMILRESMKALRADNASLFLIDESLGHLVLVKARGFSADEIGNIKLLGSWEVINNELVTKKRCIIANDVHRNKSFRSQHLPFSHERLPIKSFLAVPLVKDRAIIGALIVGNRYRPGHKFNRDDEKLLVALSNHVAIALQNAQFYQRLNDLFISTVKALVRAMEAKDYYTRGHSERVMKYSLAIGKEMNLPDEELENLRLASLLHDVGKIGVRENILLKAGRLTLRQREAIEKHSQIGKDIVETIIDSEKIIPGIVEHHEHYDGSGYPNHLKGKAISLQGRIIALADTYDALTTERPYKKGYEAESVYKDIVDSASIHFDPKVVEAFKSSFFKYPQIWHK